MQPFIQIVDHCLISSYRLTGHAGVDFVIGTFILAALCLLIGEGTLYLAFRFSRKHLEKQAEEAAKYQTLSMDALKAGNKEAFQAVDQLAKDSFGSSFFQQAALSGAFLWPVFFALAWMQTRFIDVEFPIPGTPWSLGYIGVFILIYLAAYLILKRGPRLFRRKGRFKSGANPAPLQGSPGQPAAPGLPIDQSGVKKSDSEYSA
jgi:hypothetical protein